MAIASSTLIRPQEGFFPVSVSVRVKNGKNSHRGQDFEKPTLTRTNCYEAGHLSGNYTNKPNCTAFKNFWHEPGA